MIENCFHRGCSYLSFNEVIEGVKKILEAPLIKGILSSVAWLLTKIFGVPDASLQAFLTLLIIDFITGIFKAEKLGMAKSIISHEKGRKKYMGYAVVFIISTALDISIPGIRQIALLWGTVTEARSIIENLEAIGVPMPEFIKEHLKKSTEDYKL